ncbi:MAG TPA: helix-turn-helix domain-containing protein [Longimicrobium sp.]
MAGEHSAWGELVIQGLKEAIAYQRGELTNMRVHSVEVVTRKEHLELPPWYAPFLIREIRQKLSVSQATFGEMLGVSASAVRAWEKGRREPSGPVRRLLQLTELHPDVLAQLCAIDAETDGPSLRKRGEPRGDQITREPVHPREGWDEEFARIAVRGNDESPDEANGTNSWDDKEWEWPDAPR